MIQINLLPDVKLKFLRTQRNKRLVIGLSAIVTAAFIAITVLLALHVYVNQAFHTSRLQNDIDEKIDEFKSIEDLDITLTVRQQLIALPGLHDDKPAVTRLPDFLAVIIPDNVKISELSLDFEDGVFRLDGKAEGSKKQSATVIVNKFADILKNTFYSVGGSNPVRAFADVEFDIGVENENIVSFESDMGFDEEIFDITADGIELDVPTITSTQSSLRSEDLFDSTPVPEEDI